MSNYWYMQCLSHNPPLRSEDEITQHTDDLLDVARRMWQYRDVLRETGELEAWNESTQWQRAMKRFISDHPHCEVNFVSETGETQTIGLPEEHE